MPKTRFAYPPEFRQQMIELVRSGRSHGSLACRVREYRRLIPGPPLPNRREVIVAVHPQASRSFNTGAKASYFARSVSMSTLQR